MNLKNPFKHTSYRMFYIKYRFIVVPIVLLLSSLILIFAVVFPQFQDYQKARKQQEDLIAENEQLTRNIQILSAIDDDTLSSYLSVALSAMPVRKDYIGILGAIASAAASSGTGLSDFSFSVGDTSSSPKATDPVTIKLQVQGPISSLQQFVSFLSESLPLSEISIISISGNTMNLDITFFYKPVAKPNTAAQTKLKTLSAADLALMQKLAVWPNGNEAFFSSAIPVATSSPTVASGSAF